MTFTYTDALTTDRDKIRLRTGDTQSAAGPRPDKRNFTDEEITFILSEESASVAGAIAHTFEILANEWSAWAIHEREGEVSMDAKEVAENFRKQAALWRSKPGGASEAERSPALVTMTRVDEYT
jgi:hypothetical protein